MAQDFKAKQIRGSRLIVSRSNNTTADYMIYSSSAATDLVGGIQSDMLTKVGSDVFLFVSGNMGDGNSRDDVVLFGGDVVISGTFFAEKFVAEVDQLTNNDHFVSGSVFIQNKNSNIGPHVEAKYINVGGEETKVIDVALALQGVGRNALAFDLEADKDKAAAIIYERSDKLIFSSSKGFSFNRHDGSDNEIGSDTFLYVSGTIGGKEAGTGVAVFGGDTRVSGNLDVSNSLVVTGSSVFAGGSIFIGSLEVQSSANPLDKFNISVGNDGATTLATTDNGVDANADLTIDADGEIVLDAHIHGKVTFKDGPKGAFLKIHHGHVVGQGDHTYFEQEDADQDIVFLRSNARENLRLTADGRVLIHSGGATASVDEAVGADVNFYVSGSRGILGKSNKGAAVFGGDMVVSGNLAAAQELRVTGSATFANDENFLAGYLRHLGNTDTNILFGTDFISLVGSSPTANKAGISIDGGGNGDPRNPAAVHSVIQINADGSTNINPKDVDTIIYAQGGANPSKTLFHGVAQTGNEQVLILSGGAGASVDESKGADVGFYVSGSQNSMGSTHRGVALFGGDIAISGSSKRGRYTNSSGQYTHAEGNRTTASGFYTHAEGERTVASGQASHAEGSDTMAINQGAHAEGFKTLASGLYAHSEGALTTGSATFAHAEGERTLASGQASHAEGNYTTASNSYAHAEGSLSVASGQYSHAEGTSTLASSFAAHAEGTQTVASDIASHAEGERTRASGRASHSEGYFTTASGDYSHAQGVNTVGLGYGSFVGGYYTIASGNYQSVLGRYNKELNPDSLFIVGNGGSEETRSDIFLINTGSILLGSGNLGKDTFTFVSGALASRGSDTKGMSAFGGGVLISGSLVVSGLGKNGAASSGGSISGSIHHTQGGKSYIVGGNRISVSSASNGQITISAGSGLVNATGASARMVSFFSDSDTITGAASFQFNGATALLSLSGALSNGSDTEASGLFSHAEGFTTKATAVAAHAEGGYTVASTLYAHAEGQNTLASGQASHSEGLHTTASGQYAHAEGRLTRATGLWSHAEGRSTLTIGIDSHAEGLYTTASAAGSHSEGEETYANAQSAHAEGYLTTAAQIYSHAEGQQTRTEGIASHTEGLQTTASGDYSHAEGVNTAASQRGAHSEGDNTVASGFYSHAEGGFSLASATYAHAEGLFTTASGPGSHAQGQYSVALGDYSHAGGQNTIASGSNQTVFGKFNEAENTDSLFIVGAGGHDGDRKDAFLVNSSSTGYSVRVGAGASTKLIVNEAGNVGIGTQTPGDKLEVLGNITAKRNFPDFTLKSLAASEEGRLLWSDAGGAAYGAIKMKPNETAPMRFFTSGIAGSDEKLRINADGKIGVGTTSPSGKVHIKSGESGQPAPSGFADDLIIEGSESTGISILTPNNSQGRIYFGDNDNEQRGYVLYDHALDVMKFSVANGNRMIIDQGGLSGSLTQLVDGSSYLKAGDGVSISSASNGSVTISASGAGGTIGAAEDGSYEDGLFTFFDSSTTIGTAIDRINEVLKFLAPSPATNVSDINAPALAGQTAFLSFGPGSGNNPTNYFGATVLAGNSLSSVDINESYAVATGSSGDLRAGIFNASTAVAGVINSKVLQSDFNSGAVINHVADAFGDGDKGTLSLILNGSTIVSVDLTADSAGSGNPGSGATSHLGSGDHAATGFIQLSQTGSARTQGDAEFPVFKHRTGRYTVSEASQRKGYNSLKINHVVGSTTHTTNFVEWVYDKDGTDSNTPISANDPGFNIDTLDGGTNRFDMSGVRYAVTASGEYRVRVENYYKHVYATNAISNSITNSSVITTSPATVPVINIGASEDHTKSIHVTSSFRTTAATILGTTITGDVSVAHPTKTGLSFAGSTASGRFLIYSGAANSSTNTAEAFNHEAYRVQSGSYENQSDVTGGSFDWNSTTHMTASNGGHSDGLQYYNGVLKSPKATLNSGDFRSRVDDAGATFFGAGHIYDNQPNYSGITGTRTYYRKIQNKTGAAIRDFKIQLNAGNTTIPTIVQQGTALDSQKIKVFARLPGEAGSEWLDLGQQFRYHTSSNRSGGRANVTLNTGGSPINFFTFGTGSVANNEFFVIKIEADAALTRDIGGITFTMPGIGGTPSAAPSVSTLNATNGTGVSGKLSFGSTKSITDFTNVTGGAGFESAVDINGTYGITGNRFGIFDKSVAITGSVNHDVAANGNSYPADAFGGGNAHKGQLKLEVNDSVVHTIDLSSLGLEGDTNPGGSGFIDLTTARNATGSNGLVPDFTKFWRTAKFGVATGDQRKGLNYARVIHSIEGSDSTTNYVEWLNDDDSSNLSLSNTTFSAFGESQEIYFQSGVKYFTVPTGSFMSQVSHAYSNVYSADSNAILITSVTNLGNATFLQVTGSGITNGHVSTNQMALPALDTSATDPQTLPIFVTASVAFNQSTSLPGTSPVGGTSHSAAARINVKHPLNADQASGDVNVGGNSSKKFLVFSASLSPSNAFTTERFAREDYRIVSGNYVTQNSIVDGKWDSSKDMNNSANINYYNGLLVYNGHLISPNDSRLPNGNGDFRSHFDNASSNLISPLSNVNYASLPLASSSHRYYYRYFESNITSNVFDVDVTLFGDANIVGKSGALSGSLTTDALGATKNIYVEGKIPGKTGWLDLGKASAGSGNITDGDGGLNGDIDQTVDSGGATNNLTFNGQFVAGTGVPPADRVLIRITAHKAWLGYINRIDISY